MRSEAAPRLTRRAFSLGSGLLLVAAAWPPLARSSALRVGTPAPPTTLVTLDGERIDLEALRGQVVLVTFWATWCAPCRVELPLLSRYATQHRAALRVLGFSLDAPAQLAEVRRVAQTLSFPVGLLERSQAQGYGRIWRLPVSFVIDRAGRLAVDGWREKKPSLSAEWLEQHVTPLLGGGNDARA